MVVHGSGAGHETLTQAVVGRNAAMIVDDDLHDLSLQGPVAVDLPREVRAGLREPQVLPPHAGAAVRPPDHDLAHRLYRRARLRDLLQGRGCAAHLGHHPRPKARVSASSPPASPPSICCGSRAICCSTRTTCRRCIPFEKDPPGDSLWELGLDFTVSPGKNDFRGAEQHDRLKGKERFKIFGLLVDGNVPADMGDEVYADDKKVGVITCAMYSTLTSSPWRSRASTVGGGPGKAPGNSRQARQGRRHGAHAAV